MANKAVYTPFSGDQNQAAKLADTIGKLSSERLRIDAELEAAKSELRKLVLPNFFEAAQGCDKLPQGVAVEGHSGAGLRVCMPTQIAHVDLEAVPHSAKEYFEQHFALRTQIFAVEHYCAVRVMDSVNNVLCGYGDVNWKSKLLPVPGFHHKRHQLFSPSENLAIDAAAPLSCRILV